MKIGIDIDGTISDSREFFSFLCGVLVASGHEVHIITYRDSTDEIHTKQELEELGIKYTQLHISKNEDDFNTWKAKLAEELDLDIMFDDSPEVLSKMPLKVKRFWLCSPEVYDLDHAIWGMRAATRMGTIG